MKEIKISISIGFCEHVRKIEGLGAKNRRDRFKKTNDGLCIYSGINPIAQDRIFISEWPDYVINTSNVYSFLNDSILLDGSQFGYFMYKHDVHTFKKINLDLVSEEYLLNHLNNVEDYIGKNKTLEFNRNSTLEFESKYNFLIMLSQNENICYEDYIKEYNSKYSTNFEIVENALFEDHMEVAVLSISIGTFQDLFYLGYFIALKSFKQELKIRKIIN